MNFKTTYILFGVLTLVLLVFGLSLYLGPTAKDSEPFVFPSLHNPIAPVDDKAVVEVEISRNQPQKEKIVFKRDGDSDNWLIAEPRSLRGNSINIKGLVSSLVGARRDSKADKVTNADAVGLSDPEAKVTLTLKNGKLLTLKVGKTSGGNASAVTYVISSDRADVIQAATKSDLSELTKDLAYFRDKELLTAAEGDIQRISLSEVKDGKEVGSPIELEKSKGNWVYVKPFTGEADLQPDTSPTTPGQLPAGQVNILNALTNLRADYVSDKENDFVADNVTDWAKYHLDPKSDLLKVTIQRVVAGPKKDSKENEPKETGDNLESITVFVGLDKKADERTNKYYARRSDENDVIKVPATAVDPLRELLKTPDALRDRHLVHFSNFKEPDAIDIKNADGLLEFRRLDSSKPWEMYRGTVKQDLNQLMIKGLLTQLEDRRKDITFLDPKTVKESELGLDLPAAPVVSFWVDGIEKPEPKEDKDEKKDGKDEKKVEKKEEAGKPKLKNPTKPNVRLRFAPKIGGKDTVVKREIEGSAPDYLRVPDVIFDRITQGPLAYLERKLPKFVDGINPTHDVTNLLYEQGGSIVEVKRDKPNEGPWKIVQPKSLVGREADQATVEAILQTLNNLEAVKLVAEKPSANELDRTYGLTNPSARAVVTVQKEGKPTPFTISFGKEEGQDLYAMIKQRDMVFTILKSTIASFKEPILDKVVFRFEPSKVKEIKLRRWNKDLEAPGDQVLLKDGTDWKVKGSDQKVKNPQRYNGLIEALHNLRVVKFLEGAAKPEYELGYDKGALGIEVTVDGEKEPYQLILGKEESDGYVAQSKQLGDQLFLVEKTPFKEFR